MERSRDFFLINFFNLKLSWLKQIKWFIKTFHIDILHVHDLPLVYTSYKATKGRIPLVADLHEVYPAALQVWARSSSRHNNFFYKRIFYNYNRWTYFEKRAILKATKVITVIEEAKERLIRKYGINSRKIEVISNYAAKKDIDNALHNADCSEWEYLNEYFVVSYVGGLGDHRGIDAMLLSAYYLKNKIPKLKMVIVGSGESYYLTHLKSLVQTLKIEDVVLLPGYLPFNIAVCIIKFSQIGIIPHKANEHTNNTIPHKLTQYMLARKPVIVSSCAPLKRIVEETQCGLVFSVDDAQSLAENIYHLYKNERLRIQLGNNGRTAVLEGQYNWEHEEEKLLSLYRNLK